MYIHIQLYNTILYNVMVRGYVPVVYQNLLQKIHGLRNNRHFEGILDTGPPGQRHGRRGPRARGSGWRNW